MMCIGLGYLVGAAIFPVIFAANMTYQIRSDRFHRYHASLFGGWLTAISITIYLPAPPARAASSGNRGRTGFLRRIGSRALSLGCRSSLS